MNYKTQTNKNELSVANSIAKMVYVEYLVVDNCQLRVGGKDLFKGEKTTAIKT